MITKHKIPNINSPHCDLDFYCRLSIFYDYENYYNVEDHENTEKLWNLIQKDIEISEKLKDQFDNMGIIDASYEDCRMTLFLYFCQYFYNKETWHNPNENEIILKQLIAAIFLQLTKLQKE